MNKQDILRDKFIEFLENETSTIKAAVSALKSEGNNDESTLEKIKLNVVDISKTMFNLAFRNVYVKFNNPNLKDIIESEIDEYTKLSLSFEKLIGNIITPWKLKLEKDKEFNMVEKIVIEELKLAQSDKIMTYFKELHSSI